MFNFVYRDIFITVDYYRNIFDVDKLEKINSQRVTMILRQHFVDMKFQKNLYLTVGPNCHQSNLQVSLPNEIPVLTTSLYHSRGNEKVEVSAQ